MGEKLKETLQEIKAIPQSNTASLIEIQKKLQHIPSPRSSKPDDEYFDNEEHDVDAYHVEVESQS